ncbi:MULTISPECIES: signal peptidase I [unclassified Aeromicrobium]|uniref:signal peptidase I n=1 Tax=unclassified Aeromicrobium TaxID=2633570 RepID=UPI00288B87C8|nr:MULTISPECIES: signal peptidase I [unclassified Aeromicrobium]
MRLWWRIAVQVVAWTVILAVGASLAVAVVVPRLAGATPYTVLTGSMRPELPPGTLVVVRPVDMDDISVGDTITYQLRSGEPTVVTHRVVGSGVRADGTAVLTTRGDANQVSDARTVRQEQVRGRVWYAVPYLGRLSTALDPAQRRTAVHALAAGLLLYAGWMVAAGLVARGASAKHRTTKEEAR